MSDPYRNDSDINRPYRNRGESNSVLWMGLLMAALVILGAFMFLNPRGENVAVNNAPGPNMTRPIDKSTLANPNDATIPSPTTPSTTGSAPAR